MKSRRVTKWERIGDFLPCKCTGEFGSKSYHIGPYKGPYRSIKACIKMTESFLPQYIWQ